MSSRRKGDLCLICGGDLQGNQRRWLFGAQNKRNGQPRTPTQSERGGSVSRSSQSSPWGSTLSLGSSGSLSKYQLPVNSPSKAMDLLSVLTHIVGQSVPRGGGQGEFVCGKCVSVLERVFKFDTVISRVRVLSSERLQKLTRERDIMKQWVRQNYRQRHPRDAQKQSGEEDGEAEKEGYRQMLRENMALSEYECWSEKWDTCPYFIKTGKRCRRGKGCEGCDSLRVSDSDYESVCGVPRHLPIQPFSALSRDKSQSMPLDWNNVSTVSSSPASLAGSTLSLRGHSRPGSIQSLDSVDGHDPHGSPGDPSVHFLLKELRGIEGKPVSSPSGSRIPVRGKKDGRDTGKGGGLASPAVVRTLSFGEELNGVKAEEDDQDVLTELRDEFKPLHQRIATGRVQNAIKHLRNQLDQATSRIRTLEGELRRGGDDKEMDLTIPSQEDGGGAALQILGHSLHSRERLIQECLSLIRSLCLDSGAGAELADRLTAQLSENLKEMTSDNKKTLEALTSKLMEGEKSLQEEVDALRKGGRDRERDLDTLNMVLQCNQDVINDLRVALREKEELLKEAEKERETWRQRGGALSAAMKESDALIRSLKRQLEQAVSGSVIGQDQLAALLKEREENGAILCQEVTTLTASLQESQQLLETERAAHRRAASSLTVRLQELQQELRQKEKEKKEALRAGRSQQEEREREENRLKEGLQRRDRLMEQILLDAEERERVLRELQQNLQNKGAALSALKHTL